MSRLDGFLSVYEYEEFKEQLANEWGFMSVYMMFSKWGNVETAMRRRGVNVILDYIGGDYAEKNIKLLAEGHATILERLPFPEEQEVMETRVEALEAAVKLHSKQIRELKKAQ